MDETGEEGAGAEEGVPRVQRIVEVPGAKEQGRPTLEEIVAFLEDEDFDPDRERYEFALEQDLSVDDAERLGKFKKCEVLVVAKEGGGQMQRRVITGRAGGVEKESFETGGERMVEYMKRERIPFSEVNIAGVYRKFAGGYPVVTDTGEPSGEKWDFKAHNHPSGRRVSSLSDIRNRLGVETDVILADDGMTVVGEVPERPPEKLRQMLQLEEGQEVTTEELLDDNAFLDVVVGVARVKALVEAQTLAVEGFPSTEDDIETDVNRKMCEYFGVELRMLDWEEDREEIQRVLDRANGVR